VGLFLLNCISVSVEEAFCIYGYDVGFAVAVGAADPPTTTTT
jgi:hypothetical protein